MNSIMWYRQAASEWKEGLPIGNGVLGAMVMGGMRKERIALNHELLWRGKGRHRNTSPKHQHLQEIRKLFFEGKVLDAGQLAYEKLSGPGGTSGTPNRVDPYQPAGDLFLSFDHGAISGYRRQLDLAKGLITVRYQAHDIEYRREVFAHAELPVICVRISCSEKGALSFRAELGRVDDPDCVLVTSLGPQGLGLHGKFPEGIEFFVAAKLLAGAGEIVQDLPGAGVWVKNASEVIVLLTVSVALNREDPRGVAEKQLASVPTKWSELLDRHVRKHASLFERVSIDLGTSQNEKPTDERLAAFRAGREDNGLIALYFDFGRYLLISSSRPGGLPANLQGKWNEEVNPPWECDYHHDINIQMNYWPAEVCGLPECAEPLFDYIERLVPHGREMARALYNCDGVYLPINADPWGRATPESHGWDIWTGAAAWLAQHFWWRYKYSLDKKFLRERAYPFFKDVAAFYETYLVRDPQGRLVPVPSQSPENHFEGGTYPVSLCVAATMDLELIYDVLTHAIRASEILELDRDRREKWRKILAEIPPLKIGKYGQLQEWLEDYEEVEPGHRHVSHLFGLYPGDQLTLEKTPELAKAARVSLERRLSHGGGGTGWSRATMIGLWARLGEGDRAYESLRVLLTDFTTDSLLDLHPPRIFQIEGNFGATAGIAEMLLQSHGGVIRILPALPSAWPKGAVKSLRARGGFTVDIEWADGKAHKIGIHSKHGEKCRLHIGPAKCLKVTCGSKRTQVSKSTPDKIDFPTKSGKSYIVSLES